jgi:hypothetical protein
MSDVVAGVTTASSAAVCSAAASLSSVALSPAGVSRERGATALVAEEAAASERARDLPLEREYGTAHAGSGQYDSQRVWLAPRTRTMQACRHERYWLVPGETTSLQQALWKAQTLRHMASSPAGAGGNDGGGAIGGGGDGGGGTDGGGGGHMPTGGVRGGGLGGA